MTNKIMNIYLSIVVLILISGCSAPEPELTPPPDRESLIPESQVKITRDMDVYPVTSETNDYDDPVPLPYPVNTAGAEDSAFIMPDGKTLYVWFTPVVNNPIELQVIDDVTGIYVYHQENGSWIGPERVILQDLGKASLDGCEFVLGDTMWFCTAREGYTGLHWFTADFADGTWHNWQLADFESDYQVGELHISTDGSGLYFHSSRPGGVGDMDIWVSKLVNGEWGEPENITVVNSPHADGWPFLSQDGTELWFTRAIGAPELYRSMKVNGEWTDPVKMFSNFSGEASLDINGNVYFTHHYFKDDEMLEADIYLARKK
jgi:hypothetical protein